MNETMIDQRQPADWWRHLCEVTDRMHVCGDLPHHPEEFRRVLGEWTAAGITHIVDVRGEWSDAGRVAEAAPHITYVWLGTHDEGGDQDFSWFDAGVTAIEAALADPAARVVVHCHMGVNRAPSMAFAALLELGFGIEEGLDAIRDARPIAAILYADSAVRWFGHRDGWNEISIAEACRRVWIWRADNPVDAPGIIGRIRQYESAVA